MSASTAETLELNQEKIFAHAPGDSLALVDVETYPAFVAQKADRLDMMAHFSNQMQALTALSWKAPETARRFRLLLTENDFLIERLSQGEVVQIASGNLRTYGQLCLATHKHLFDCARHRNHDLLHATSGSKTPHILEVPPGVYAIALYADTSFRVAPEDAGEGGKPTIDYTIILRHYAFPPPRVAPVRLRAGFIPWAGEEAVAAHQAWAKVTSHKMPA